MNTFRAKFACLVAIVGALGISPIRAAQPWPADMVKLIVPFPPGGGIDIIARLTADRLTQKFGKTFIVENRGGAGTIIGTQAVADAAPDGRIFLITTSNFTINPSLYRKLPYNTESMVPVSMIAIHPSLLLVRPGLGVSSVEELLAKAKKDSLSYASPGNGTAQHLNMEILMNTMGIRMVHVPYKGAAPALNDMLSGSVDVMWLGISPTRKLLEAGKLKAIALNTPARVAAVPNVPSAVEAGLPKSLTLGWSALIAPPRTDPAIVKALSTAIAEIVREPETRAKLEENGLVPSGMSSPELNTFFNTERATWSEVVRRTGAKVE